MFGFFVLIVWIFLNCFFVIFNCLVFLIVVFVIFKLFVFLHANRGQTQGPRRVGPRRVGPRRVMPGRVGGPKFRVFFFFPPPQNSFFSSLSGGLLVEFWWCLKRWDAQMCVFGVLWLSCASPGGPVWWGRRVSHDSPRAQTRTFLGSGLQNTTKNSTRRHPERHKKSEMVAGKGRKRAKFWVAGGGVSNGGGGPAERP